jgi:hypothetical protein
MAGLSEFVQNFKETDPSLSKMSADVIFSELIQMAKQGLPLPKLSGVKNEEGEPLSFYFVDEIASASAKQDMALILSAIDLHDGNDQKKTALHVLLSQSKASTLGVERALSCLLSSKAPLPVSSLLLLVAEFSFGVRYTPLEYAAFMKCHACVAYFLNALRQKYPNELKSALAHKLDPSKTLGASLLTLSVDAKLLSSCGYP